MCAEYGGGFIIYIICQKLPNTPQFERQKKQTKMDNNYKYYFILPCGPNIHDNEETFRSKSPGVMFCLWFGEAVWGQEGLG